MKQKSVRLILLIFSSFLLIIGLIVLINYYRNRNQEVIVPPAPEVKMAWDFPVDSIKIDTFTVRQNQCLSDILSDRGVSLVTIDQLAKNSVGVFDVRRIKSGNNYFIVSKKNSIKPTHFIYEENVSDYFVFSLSDTIVVKKGEKDIDTTRCTFSGVIESSLWNTFIDNGANPNLCIALSDVFAWTVDFFGVQKGDRFKVIYDQYSVEGKFAGIGKIHTAVFEASGEEVPAYYFAQNGQEGFFDDKGNSLRKAFLKAPLNFSRISSRFSASRFHPVLKIRRPHHGVDYAAPTGTPVYSIGDGVVIQKAYQGGGGGNYITIKHNSVYTSQYMHLSKYAQGISAGTRVKQGQLIGFVGMTGLASGPHLDFRIFMNGSAVDPLKVKTPPVEPINEANKALFATVRDSLDKILDAVPYTNQIVSKR
jgi:murein DD-endopeptidase MepM/ murein hydrolase activator NlpD